jgi:hypothetical protein
MSEKNSVVAIFETHNQAVLPPGRVVDPPEAKV